MQRNTSSFDGLELSEFQGSEVKQREREKKALTLVGLKPWDIKPRAQVSLVHSKGFLCVVNHICGCGHMYPLDLPLHSCNIPAPTQTRYIPRHVYKHGLACSIRGHYEHQRHSMYNLTLPVQGRTLVVSWFPGNPLKTQSGRGSFLTAHTN